MPPDADGLFRRGRGAADLSSRFIRPVRLRRASRCRLPGGNPGTAGIPEKAGAAGESARRSAAEKKTERPCRKLRGAPSRLPDDDRKAFPARVSPASLRLPCVFPPHSCGIPPCCPGLRFPPARLSLSLSLSLSNFGPQVSGRPSAESSLMAYVQSALKRTAVPLGSAGGLLPSVPPGRGVWG